MANICQRCLYLRKFLPVYKSVNRPWSLTWQVAQHYSTKDRTSEKRYKDGKLIVEEIEDPTYFPKYLLTLKSSDESVLNGYFKFVKKAANMTDINMTKSFSMPASSKTYKAKREDSKGSNKEEHYILKEFRRMVEITDLTSEKNDIFMKFILNSVPAGVDINIDLKRWELLVDPDHPSLRGEK